MKANAVEGGTIEVEEEGGGNTGAQVVATLAFNKGTTMVEEGTIVEPTKVASTLSSLVTGTTS